MKKVLLGVAIFLVLLLGVLVTLGIYVKNSYNRMVVMQEGVNASWAQVQTVLQRRFDLIPNLVETVKGYASHEERVLIAVTEARMRAEGELSGALSRLLVVVENYPQLKANQNFIMLQDQLEGTENRISVERQRYNEEVRGFNQYIRMFPQTIIASMFRFEKRAFFEAPGEAQQAPKVQFK